MSWFGGGLSQFSSLTDQISTFTKDVLTETTEEVEDPAAELHVARKKIEDLEHLNRHIQTEWEKLKKHSEELNERAETAEYQIATISQEYRKLFQDKDSELRRLKTENENLKEQQKRLIPLDGSVTQSPLKELATQSQQKEFYFGGFDDVSGGGLGGAGGAMMVDGWGEEFHDFSDVVSSQSEINRLQSELGSLKVECQHWKTVAQEKMGAHPEPSCSEDNSANLREQIKELQHSLRQEQEQHQRELTALQTVQSQRLQSLSQRHQQEVDQLQQQLQEMQRAGKLRDSNPYVEEDHPTTDAAESITALQKSLEESQTRYADLEGEVLQLREKMEGGQPSLSPGVESSRASLEETNTELSKRVGALEEERMVLKGRVGELMAELEEVRGEREKVVSAQEQRGRQLEAALQEKEQLNKELREQLELTKLRHTALQESNEQLMAKLEKEQLTMSQLHGEISALKQQVMREKDAQIHLLEEEKEKLASNLSEMQSGIARHEESVCRLQEQHGRSLKEVEVLNSQIEALVLEVRSKEGEIATLKEGVCSEEAEELKALLEESESARTELQQENERLKNAEAELKSQLANDCTSTKPDGGLSDELTTGGYAQRVEQLEAELQKQRSENEDISKELSRLRGRSDVGVDRDRGDSSFVINKTEDSTEDVELRVRTESEKCKRLQAHLAQMAEEHDAELGQLLSEKESLERKVVSLKEELDTSLLTQNDALFESNRLKMENSQLLEDLSQQRETASRLETQLESLQVSQNMATGTMSRTHQETGQFEDVDLSYQQLPVESATNSQLTERLQSLEAEIARKNGIIVTLEAANAKFESSRRKFEGSLEQLGEEKAGLEKEVQSMEAENRQLRSDLQDLKDELEENRHKSSQELQTSVQQKEEQILQLHAELQRLQRQGSEGEKAVLQLAELQKHLEECSTTVKSHEQNLQEMRDILSKRENEISELRKQSEEGKLAEEKLLSKCAELERGHLEEKTALLERLAHLEQQEIKLVHSEHQTDTVGEPRGDGSNDLRSFSEQQSKELAQVTSDRDSLKISLIAKEEEIVRLSGELTQTKDDLSQQVASLSADNEKLVQELDVLKPEASSLKAVRSQLEMRVEVLEGSYNALQREMEEKLGAKQSECVRYTKELSRLKTHLVEVEEQYTQEALRADEQVVGLKQQIADLEDKLQNSSIAGQVQSEHNQQQLEDLREQLHVLAAQRDDTFLQLASAQEEASHKAEALHNLQAVLEQFQKDKASELSVALQRSQMELSDALQERERMRREQQTTMSEMEEMRGALEAAGVLGQELEEKEKRIEELMKEVEKLRGTLDETQQKMEALSRNDRDCVDRSLVKNLVLGYLHAPDRKKTEVLSLISKILDFTQEELDQALGRGSGWISRWWPRTPSSPQPSTRETSFSQTFIKFLETESTPPQTPNSLPSSHIPSSVIGYVDPRTDPDRPSLATAAIIGRPTPFPSHPSVSLSGSGKHSHLPSLPSFPTAQTPLKSVGLSTSELLPHHNPKPTVQSSPIVNPETNLHPEPTHTPAAATKTGHRSHPVSSTGNSSAQLSHSVTDTFLTHPSPSAPYATNNRKTDSSSLFAFSPIRQANKTQSFQSSLLRSVLSD